MSLVYKGKIYRNIVNVHKKINYLSRQLMEEQLSQTTNSFIMIHDTGRHFTDLTFDLHHVVKDEMGQDLYSVVTDLWRLISQSERAHIEEIFQKYSSASIA